MKRLRTAAQETRGVADIWSTRLCDLHEGSWISVAWYPIYRVPDSPLRTCFLTYHAPGGVALSPPTTALPPVGFKWYFPATTGSNNEHWFASHAPEADDAHGVQYPTSIDLRLNELEYNATVLARGSLRPINEPAKRRHPDWEFFSRRNATTR